MDGDLVFYLKTGFKGPRVEETEEDGGGRSKIKPMNVEH
jgi:hypothetical protein